MELIWNIIIVLGYIMGVLVALFVLFSIYWTIINIISFIKLRNEFKNTPTPPSEYDPFDFY